MEPLSLSLLDGEQDFDDLIGGEVPTIEIFHPSVPTVHFTGGLNSLPLFLSSPFSYNFAMSSLWLGMLFCHWAHLIAMTSFGSMLH